MSLTPHKARRKIGLVKQELEKVLFGVGRPIDITLQALVARVPFDSQGGKKLGAAHVLYRDPPGRGKSALVNGLAHAIGLKSTLITGHPEMTTTEIAGHEMYHPPTGKFFLRKGPIFTNLVRFDEINRTHPRAQAEFLQAMEERIVVLGVTDAVSGEIKEDVFALFPVNDDPNKLFFWVLATANPVEQEGTYSLPEAQLDRFTVSVKMGLPSWEEEKRIRLESVSNAQIERVLEPEEILEIADLIVATTRTTANANEYIMRLIASSRSRFELLDSAEAENPSISDKEKEEFLRTYRKHMTPDLREFIDRNVSWGLSPRSNFHFQAMARTNAFMKERDHITYDDVKTMAHSIMSHRIILSPEAISGNITASMVVQKILNGTEVNS